ncbi:hypothetical protein SPBR_06923 [Sporothrix brasiliensis 5110]|uniref:ubiquitinyl hydrolase 1 n=1 Tax=Sporothrix brasiliensis 5110 TaxID=1398154 RepID=A0A0C2ERJ0_9PEZI|nr:uncharacterized protein SPBR_06923 [Sporothrix brasiliensis 5110]KIH88994.1 hypothetical protein SPBR_06923 [Sporothrix brasiliensis 5110]
MIENKAETQGQSRRESRRISTADDGWQSIPPVSDSMEELQEEDAAASDMPIVVHAEQVEDKNASASCEVTMSDTGVETAMNSDGSAPFTTSDSQLQQTVPGAIQTVFDPPPVAEASVESIIECALEDTSVKGTDQQDVEEVMGNIISHLRASVKATGEDVATGVQRDPITDTFFWTSATYSRSDRNGSYNRQVAPNRWVTAFPAEDKKIGLLQALSNSFQREFITQGTWYERFTSIVGLPPILHIHIQRSKGDGTKNKSLVDIPQALHLDQFMDCDEGSDLFNRRRHAWNIQERIRSLKGPNGENPYISFLPDAVGKAAAYTDMIVNEHLHQHAEKKNTHDDLERAGASSDNEFDSDDGDYDMIDDDVKELLRENDVVFELSAVLSGRGQEIETQLDTNLDQRWSNEATKQFLDGARHLTREDVQNSWAQQDSVLHCNDIMRNVQQIRAEYEQELEGLFADLKAPQNKYLLHAVICHSGNTGKAGHYWVWIYDFERGLWRKYNDKAVKEFANTDVVMAELSNGGEPYYLAYVRASDVEKYVGVSLRKERSPSPAVPPAPPRPQPRLLPTIPEATPAPPGSNSEPHRLITPPQEEGEPEDPSIGGFDGQSDGKTLQQQALVQVRASTPISDGQTK